MSAKHRICKFSMMIMYKYDCQVQRINMVAKCIVYMYIAAQLKAYWLTCLCTNVRSVCALQEQCSGTYMFNLAAIYVVMYFEYVYSASYYIVDCSDLIYACASSI